MVNIVQSVKLRRGGNRDQKEIATQQDHASRVERIKSV